MSDSQVAGIKAHAEAKNKETIDKVNKAIDKLVRRWQKETDGSVSRLWRTQIWEWATKETVGKEVNVEPLELDKLEFDKGDYFYEKIDSFDDGSIMCNEFSWMWWRCKKC